jgi:hypothetical protein
VALAEAGPRARLSGRCERGSAEVGMLSGIGSDMMDEDEMSDCARVQCAMQEQGWGCLVCCFREKIKCECSRFACLKGPQVTVGLVRQEREVVDVLESFASEMSRVRWGCHLRHVRISSGQKDLPVLKNHFYNDRNIIKSRIEPSAVSVRLCYTSRA